MTEDGRTPLAYVKYLFLTLAFDEALEYLKEIDMYYDDYIHFAIVLEQSGMLETLQQLSNPAERRTTYKVSLLQVILNVKDTDFTKALTSYALTLFNKEPIQALYYLKLLDHGKRVEQEHITNTVSNFILNNNKFNFFFASSLEQNKNVHLV